MTGRPLEWKRWILAGAVALIGALARGEDPAKNPNAVNPTSDPFYRKYLVAGNPLDDEILAMEKRIEEAPNDSHLRNDFGNLLALRRFPEQAGEQYELAVELDASNFISYYNLGLLRETEGKTGPAISAYKKSIARKPGFPPARFRLGWLYELTGKSDEAVAQYAKALWIDPAMRDPKRNPLVINSELMYRASIANYQRDMARIALDLDVAFAVEPAFRRVPVDRAVAAAEVEEAEDPGAAPREVGPTTGGVSSAPGTVRRPPRAAVPAEPTTSKPRPPGSRPPRARPGTPPGAPIPVTGAPAEPTPAVVVPEEPGAPQMPPENVPEPEATPVPEGEVEPS